MITLPLCFVAPDYVILPIMRETSPHHPISSKDNSIVHYLRSLADPKHRKKEQVFLIEGVKVVEEALREELGITMLVVTPSITQHHGKGVLKLAESKSVEIVWISERLMDFLSESKTPQPAMAVVRMRIETGESLVVRQPGLIILAHQLQDPGNLGSIIRTAEAVGNAGVAVTPHTVDPFNAKTVRASMGSILRCPVAHVGDPVTFIENCRQKGYQAAALSVAGTKTHFDLDLTKPTVVIVGREGTGLPADITEAADHAIRIPMMQTIDSLNAAVSAAIVLYEAMRQKTNKR